MGLTNLEVIIGIVSGSLGIIGIIAAYNRDRDDRTKQRYAETQRFETVLAAVKSLESTIESKFSHLTGNIKQNNAGLVEELRENKTAISFVANELGQVKILLTRHGEK